MSEWRAYQARGHNGPLLGQPVSVSSSWHGRAVGAAYLPGPPGTSPHIKPCFQAWVGCQGPLGGTITLGGDRSGPAHGVGGEEVPGGSRGESPVRDGGGLWRS